MKKRLCLLLALLVMCCAMLPAFAAPGTIDEISGNLKQLTVDVAVSGASSNDSLSFLVTVDGSDAVQVKASKFPDNQVGHIIVIDQGWTWTKSITWETLLPAVNAYLNTIPSGQMVMFVLSEDGQTNYMSVSQARTYARDNITLPATPTSATGKPSKTSIDSALTTAFVKATENGANDPMFKNVFALVDPGSSGIGDSATAVRDNYIKEGGFFPVLIATVYPKTFMEKASSNNTADDAIERGMSHYNAFAADNGSVLARMNYVSDETLPTSAITTMKVARSYYTLDLSPLHKLIDYSKKEHEISVNSSDGRSIGAGITLNNVPSSMLPTPLPTATPTRTPKTVATTAPVTPTPTVTPTATPDPYVVRPGDETEEAFLAIRALREMYYLEEDSKPGSFDVVCQYAFMEFCRLNGLPEELNVSQEAYAKLLGGKAVAYPTATPTPAAVTPTPSPTPTAVPMIYIGCKNTNAARVILKLQELFYLDKGTSSNEWDSTCMLAFQQLCEDNGFQYTDEFIDDEMYNWVIGSNLTPKSTATPEPVITPVPEATIPPEGYQMYMTDEGDSNYLAQMQTILQNLNLYDPEQPMTLGMLDQPTMDAVNKYCATYGLAQQGASNTVAKSIITDILTNGAKRAPYVEPDPTMSEQLVGFLQKEALKLGTFSVKMWMLLALVVLVVFVILLIVILTNRKANDNSGSSLPVKNQPRNAQMSQSAMTSATAAGARMPQNATPSSYGGDESTVPVGHGGGFDDDPTRPLNSGINVTLNISGGRSAGARNVIIRESNFVIGRPSSSGVGCDLPLEGDPSVSRKHAALTYQNGQLFLYNLSSNGTRVNGQPIGDNQSSAASEETMPLNASAKQGNSGYAVRRGDTIEISNYRITVNW